MNKLMILLFLVFLILPGCKSPNYGSDKEDTNNFEITSGTEVAKINGYVVEITEDNIIRIKVPKRGELIQKGWVVNEEGIVKVALASVKLPTDNLPLSEETNTALRNLLLNKEITFDVLREAAASVPLNEVQGYIHLKDNDSSIQEILIANGLAIIDKSSPYVSSYMSEFEKIQAAAQKNTLGVWAIDGFVNISNSIGGQFTDVVDMNEEEIKSILKEIKVKGKDIGNSIFN